MLALATANGELSVSCDAVATLARNRKEPEMTGRVVHFEVPYDDADRARAFYSDLFGCTSPTARAT
jgi:hypothetical protein